MKIGLITSYHEVCGVSSYTENLANYLISKGLDVKVGANYPKAQLCPDEEYVKRFFHTPFMTNGTTADVDGLVLYFKDRDIIHFQFETNLYHPDYFNSLLQKLRLLNKPIIFTMHSSGMWPSLNLNWVDFFITHSNMWVNEVYPSLKIPMGVKFYSEQVEPKSYKSICSFGLGRNNDDRLKANISSDVLFTTTYGNQSWKPLDELIKTIQESWIISLLYPPVGSDVSSSAVITAMGCNRPILVTNTKWFSHIMDYNGVYVCQNDEDIKTNVEYLTNDENISKIKEDLLSMRQELLNNKRTFEDFGFSHINLYKNLCNDKAKA